MTSDEMFKQITFRHMKEKDEPFVFSSWLKSYFMDSYFTKNLSKTIFFECHHKIIEKIFARSSTFVIIAHAINEPDLILAYLVYEYIKDKIIVHYVYVKEAFRKENIAKEMLKSVTQQIKKTSITHMTNSICVEHVKQKYELIYNPYLM